MILKVRPVCAVLIGIAALGVTAAGQPAPQAPAQPRAVFRTSRDAVSVDIIVRDKSGAIVRGLTAADFEVREDGRPQEIVSFTFEEIATKPLPPIPSKKAARCAS